jgi:hypothetical protein
MKVKFAFLFLSLVLGFRGLAAQLVTEPGHSACEEYKLAKDLRVYKDPSLFIGSLGQMYNDPKQGWSSLMEESPVLTTLQGTVHLMKLGIPSEFKNFGVISRIYELADSSFKPRLTERGVSTSSSRERVRPLVVPVKVCGSTYGDSLGFVLISDLEKAQQEERDPGVLPPSVYPNPVPTLRRP